MFVNALRTKGKVALCGALMLLGLSGCAAVGQADRIRVPVAQGYYSVQSQWPAAPVQLWQHVRWSQQDQQREFLVSALLKKDRVLLVALSPLGNELFRSELTPSGHRFTGSEFLSEPRLALQVWADLQMALWPIAQVNRHLTNAELTLSGSKRTLIDDGNLIWSSTVELTTGGRITHHTRDYNLRITTLQNEVLSNDDINTQ